MSGTLNGTEKNEATKEEKHIFFLCFKKFIEMKFKDVYIGANVLKSMHIKDLQKVHAKCA